MGRSRQAKPSEYCHKKKIGDRSRYVKSSTSYTRSVHSCAEAFLSLLQRQLGKMVSSKRVSKNQTSKVSSQAALAASATTKTDQKSAIFHSLFSPSQFQLSLFASVIQGLDGQHLRIHDTNTGRLRYEHAIASKATINCLDWGHYGENHPDRRHQESNKKRKRSAQANRPVADSRSIVLAFGTSDSEIFMFSPTETKIVGILKGEHTHGIKDFRFVDAGKDGTGWSIGGDGKLVHWDLRKGQSIRCDNILGDRCTSVDR